MSYSPLVSVIIPAYNASSWIAETISSVIAQDYEQYEIIVVDDGSTDNTADIVRNFGDPVRYFYKQNGGQASARNVGIKIAQGKYLAFLDSDDLWTKEKLRLQVEQLESSGAKWGYADAIAFDNSNKETLYQFSDNLRQYEGDILKPLFKACFIPSPTPIVERSVFEVTGLFNESPHMRNREDWEMWLRIAAVYPVALITHELAYYRVHPGSATQKEESDAINKAGYLAVVEEAALREKDRLAPMKNLILSRFYFRDARWNASLGNTALARKIIGQSIKLTPGWLFLYIYWLMIPVVRWVKIPRKKLRINFAKALVSNLFRE